MSRIRLFVADQAEAISTTLLAAEAAKEVARISDPAAHQHNRDFESDGPVGPTRALAASARPCARE